MDITPTDIPSNLLDVLTEPKSPCPASGESDLADPLCGVLQGQRNDAVFKLGCNLRGKGYEYWAILALMRIKASNCTPPLPASEVTTTFNSVMSYQISSMEIPLGMDGHELWHSELEEPEWIVPGILPTGLAILAGSPKAGKSFAALGLILEVAKGGIFLDSIPVEQNGVLYLALEDTPARLKDRMMLLSDSPPEQGTAIFHNHWPKNGFEVLRNQLLENPTIKLVVIDTLGKIRAAAKTNANLYDKDYDDIGRLKKIADELGICILLIHHTRKSKSADVLEMISGTNAIAGAADTIWILSKKSGGDAACLHVQGRDVQENNLLLEFIDGNWEFIGSAEFGVPNPIELRIMKLLQKNGPMKSKEISSKIKSVKKGSINATLNRMVEKGYLVKVEHGVYDLL